jgi:hypothetical protein
MLFLVEDALFASPDESLLLSTLVGLCLVREHRFLVMPEGGPHLEAWLQNRPWKERDATKALIAGTNSIEPTEPAVRRVRVGATGIDWEARPPKVSLSEAIELASRPFGIMLEGLTGDRAFLLACATSDERRRLDEMVRNGSLEFVNGGGLDSMAAEVDKLSPRLRLLRWALFDGDALVPDEPSPQAVEAKEICERRGVRHHRLARRAIENYLPEATIKRWAGQGTGTWQQRRAQSDRARAWLALSCEQRAHYGMKRGFEGDEERCRRLKGDARTRYERFWVLSPRVRSALAKGLAHDIAKCFEAGPSAGITGDVMQADETIKNMMRELMEWLR